MRRLPFYGRFIARQYALDDARSRPRWRSTTASTSCRRRPFYLLGQHFSAIAAAGPIAGPILACQQFGWLPCILWIALGVVFIGAVHDFSRARRVGAPRGRARSPRSSRSTSGPRAWLAIMLFIWLALVYVIVAFADVTASTFVGRSEELDGRARSRFNPGGAVALASVAVPRARAS